MRQLAQADKIETFMGVNICLYRTDGTEHPEWDWGRYAGDSEIARYVTHLPSILRRGLDDKDPWGESHFRPADFDAWRTAAAAHKDWPNPGRFERLIDLLEKNPDCWVYLSW